MKAALAQRVKLALSWQRRGPVRGCVAVEAIDASRSQRFNSPTLTTAAILTAHEIFSGLAPAEAHELLESLHEANKPAYKGVVQATAARRKLRPVFLERKPRAERHQWMQGVLGQPASEDLALEILQNWLLGPQRAVLSDFLDALEIRHEDGLIDDIPPQPPREKVDAAVEAIAAKHPALAVKVYLNLFQPLDAGAWPDLDALLVIDPRLALIRK